jgi:7-carboxy-7-deazaguanine synthase
MLKLCEIFRSLQGESTRAGLPCAFVRLSGCNLDCCYCDTSYAQIEGEARSLDDIVSAVQALGCRLVEVTGGEPLHQAETPVLCRRLQDLGMTVLIETNGSLDISVLPPGCIRIVDVKCPDSGMGDSFYQPNLRHLLAGDELKMVISSWRDFEWALEFVERYRLALRTTVIFSPNTAAVSPAELAAWILESDAPVRLGLQLHKIIWGADARGV